MLLEETLASDFTTDASTTRPSASIATATPSSSTYQTADGTLTLTSAGVKSRSAGDGKWFWLVGAESERHWPGIARAIDRADLVVGNEVLVELKSVEEVSRVHSKQVLTYLKLMGLRLGFLLNFGAPLLKDGIERIVLGYVPRSTRER
mgnify:CR=1 FL=1